MKYILLTLIAGVTQPMNISICNQDIHQKIKNFESDNVKKLLYNCPHLVNAVKNSQTPLHVATEIGDRQMVEVLCENNANVNEHEQPDSPTQQTPSTFAKSQGYKQCTPAHIAALREYPFILNTLQKHGANFYAYVLYRSEPTELEPFSGPPRVLTVYDFIEKNNIEEKLPFALKNSTLCKRPKRRKK